MRASHLAPEASWHEAHKLAAVDELQRALELDRRVQVRAGLTTFDIPEGVVVLHGGLPNVYSQPPDP